MNAEQLVDHWQLRAETLAATCNRLLLEIEDRDATIECLRHNIDLLGRAIERASEAIYATVLPRTQEATP